MRTRPQLQEDIQPRTSHRTVSIALQLAHDARRAGAEALFLARLSLVLSAIALVVAVVAAVA